MNGRAQGVVLALDVGTSSCRASLYDLRAEPIPERLAHVRYAPILSPDGGAQLDPEVLLDQVCAAIDGVLADIPSSTGILAVASSVFWHSLLGVDAQGRPCTPVYLWMDARARGQVAALRARLDEQAVHARTGCVLHWSYWPAKLAWLRETQPAAFRAAARWLSFGELLREKLTGAVGVSLSMASGTGLLDVHACEWDAEMLDVSGLTPDRLSPLVPLTDAPKNNRWPLLRDTPWLAAIGDGACSNVGTGCLTPERAALMIGTSGAERAAWSPAADFEVPSGVWGYRIDGQRILIGGALNDGGSLLDWLRGGLHLPDSGAVEAELEGMEADSHGLTVLPFWAGERSPGYADDARGAIVGMRLSTRPVEILRACLEGVALRFAEIDRSLRQAMPGAAHEVIATGGALLHSPAWMQIIADVLDRPVLASAEAEASSRGAALLALDALRLLDQPLDAQQPAVTRRFEPVPARAERYRAALERQRRLYDALVA
jgi:gluconokinase